MSIRLNQWTKSGKVTEGVEWKWDITEKGQKARFILKSFLDKQIDNWDNYKYFFKVWYLLHDLRDRYPLVKIAKGRIDTLNRLKRFGNANRHSKEVISSVEDILCEFIAENKVLIEYKKDNK